MSFAVLLDVETTGVDAQAGSVVELAAARVHLQTGKLIDARSFLIARYRGEHGAEDVHGIPAALVDEFGLDFVSSTEGLRRYVAGSVAICAHFCDFDRSWFPVLGVPWVDSNDFETPRSSSSRSLTALALAHGVGVVRAHRALDDVLTLATLMERAKELGADLTVMVEHALRPRITLQAIVSYDDRQKAKDAGFSFVDTPSKMWIRRFVQGDPLPEFPFKTREVAA